VASARSLVSAARMLPVDMDEAQALSAGMPHQLGRAHRAGIAFHGDAAIRSNAMLQAVRLETLLHPLVGPGKQSTPSAISPGSSAWASAMKKRPSKVPISAMGPATPSSVCNRSNLAEIAAAKRDDMPTTLS
jgi:hypothetical protein